jgi:hypothetical protein
VLLDVDHIVVDVVVVDDVVHNVWYNIYIQDVISGIICTNFCWNSGGSVVFVSLKCWSPFIVWLSLHILS